MVNIAVLGYGVVGSGVVEVINKNRSSIRSRAGKDIVVKKILDVRDFSDSPDKDLFTKNSDDVFNDASISVIVETIGGARIAYEFTKRALQTGKHVVTSNKELVATHGPELLQLAKDNGVNYLFEASVGGGIPIIRPLNQCLAANELHEITGILNGTTNYILTQMRREGKDFNEALKEAQQNGYAEADPTADIEGHDACRKIAILSSIAYNEFVDYKNISTKGIKSISLLDMKYVDKLDAVIKLVGMSRKIDKKIYARVSPAVVSKSHPLANVDDVFNAIVVNGDAIGEAMFYGRGAGKLPTASAVVADVIDIVKHIDSSGRKTLWTVKEYNNMVDPQEIQSRFFIRLRIENLMEARRATDEIFGKVKFITMDCESCSDEIAFVSDLCTEKELESMVAKMKVTGHATEVLNIIPFL